MGYILIGRGRFTQSVRNAIHDENEVESVLFYGEYSPGWPTWELFYATSFRGISDCACFASLPVLPD